MAFLRQGLDPSFAKRKLASIQEIKEINPIENADAIEVAKVLGWEVVVKKDSVKKGDKIVYFEIDSFLPPSNKYSFVGKERVNPITLGSNYEVKGFRLATAVLRGQVSQGLIVKFEDLDPTPSGKSIEELIDYLSSLEVGTEVTEILGVTKFERPEVIGELGKIVGSFPSHHIAQTDEERVQTEPESFKKIKGESYYITSKVDGTSITNIFNNNQLISATRNNTLEDDNKIREMLKKQGVLRRLEELNEDISFQSELYGSKIQKNKLGIVGNRLATFTISKDGVILGLEEMLDVVDKLGLEMPEIIEIGSNNPEEINRILSKIQKINSKREYFDPSKFSGGLLKIKVQNVICGNNYYICDENGVPAFKSKIKGDGNFNYKIEELISMANGRVYSSSGKLEEGFVVRSIKGQKGRKTISFKVLNNSFLLKD